MNKVLTVCVSWMVAASFGISAQQPPWPGDTLIASAQWEGEVKLPLSPSFVPSGGAMASFLFSANPPSAELGLQAGYAWATRNTGEITISPEIGLEAGYRFVPFNLFSLTPFGILGAAVPVAGTEARPCVRAEAGIRGAFRLGGREYLTVAPSVSYHFSPLVPPSFGIAFGTRSERAWNLPLPETNPVMTPVPRVFSPDGDGIDDILAIRVSTSRKNSVASWILEVKAPSGKLAKRFSGSGDVPGILSWNAAYDSAVMLDSATDIDLELTTKDILGRTDSSKTKATVDILVIREGDRYKIRIQNILFPSNSADFNSVSSWMQTANERILSRLIAIFSRFPDYSIVVEGHANSTAWQTPETFRAENEQDLIPLSVERAEAVRNALIRMGISEHLIRAAGAGGNRPIYPFHDEENAWRNRRVEFILSK